MLESINIESDFEADVIRSSIIKINQHIDTLEQHTQKMKESVDVHLNTLKNDILYEVQQLREQLSKIDKFSKFNLKGSTYYTIRIDVPQIPSEEDALFNIEFYLKDCIKELNLSAYEDHKVIRKRIDNMMHPMNLFNVLIPLKTIKVKIRQPSQFTVVQDFEPWDIVAGLCGSQQYSCYFYMFVTVQSFIRSRLTGEKDSGSVLICDNPFSVASAEFILRNIFALADENNIQLICYSGLKDSDIYIYFPITYSAKLTKNYDRLILTGERLNRLVAGGYRK
jgi:hypothetical protein